MSSNSFNEFQDIYNELKEKKLSELRLKDIAKYILLSNELNWVDNNIEDNKNLYNYYYDKEQLEKLSYEFEEAIDNLVNEDILYNNDLHVESEEFNYEL